MAHASTRTDTGAFVESEFIPLPNGAKLHMRRFCGNPEGWPVFLLHGSIENGKIFYSESGKGLAPYLAAQGYDVFVADMQGRGLSTPPVGKGSHHGMKELLEDEFPAFLRHIHGHKGDRPMHWIAHSWGGVDMLTYLARPAYPAKVASMVFFGSKRRIGVRNLTYAWKIGFGWNTVAPLIIRRRGYLAAVRYGFGADNITVQTFRDTDYWIRQKEWKHPEDGFDYAAALQAMDLPPTLYFAGKKDSILGHPSDVLRLAQETGPDDRYRYHLLSKAHGNLHDYGHIDMLTHPAAPQDHFPMVLEWLRRHETPSP